MNNILKKHTINHKTGQRGVTLLLAILILSSILSISFSIATILFVEVRTSGDLLRTETALYGAGAVTEEALFKIKRGLPANGAGSLTYTPKIGPVDLNNPAPVENILNDPVQRVTVAPGTSFSQTPNHYVFFDPNAQYQTSGSGYGKVVITNLSTNPSDQLSVYLCQFDPTAGYPCDNPAPGPAWLVSTTLTSSQPPITVDQSSFFDPSKQQELILYNTTSNNIYVEIKTYAQLPGYAPLGLPFFGSESVDINANYGSVGRRLRVLIPNQ